MKKIICLAMGAFFAFSTTCVEGMKPVGGYGDGEVTDGDYPAPRKKAERKKAKKEFDKKQQKEKKTFNEKRAIEKKEFDKNMEEEERLRQEYKEINKLRKEKGDDDEVVQVRQKKYNQDVKALNDRRHAGTDAGKKDEIRKEGERLRKEQDRLQALKNTSGAGSQEYQTAAERFFQDMKVYTDRVQDIYKDDPKGAKDLPFIPQSRTEVYDVVGGAGARIQGQWEPQYPPPPVRDEMPAPGQYNVEYYPNGPNPWNLSGRPDAQSHPNGMPPNNPPFIGNPGYARDTYNAPYYTDGQMVEQGEFFHEVSATPVKNGRSAEGEVGPNQINSLRAAKRQNKNNQLAGKLNDPYRDRRQQNSFEYDKSLPDNGIGKPAFSRY